MGQRKNIVLFGGSFNPPHDGHVAIVRRLARRKTVNEVWILPVYRHRFRKRLFPFPDRMRLCRQVFGPLSRKVQVKDLEKKVRGGGRTLSLILYLQKQFPRYRFYLALGSDAYRQRHSWYRFDEIQKRVKLIIFPRGPRSPIPNVASRQIRCSLSRGRLPVGLPSAVQKFFKKSH